MKRVESQEFLTAGMQIHGVRGVPLDSGAARYLHLFGQSGA